MAEVFTKFSEYGVQWILSALFPTFCGYFPVYFMRLEFAAPLFVGQFALLLLTAGIFSRLQKRTG
jgi:hypothetical protein